MYRCICIYVYMVKHLYKQLEHQLAKKSGNIQTVQTSNLSEGFLDLFQVLPSIAGCMKNAMKPHWDHTYIYLYSNYSIWLVVDPPLWKKIVSQLGWWLPIYGKKMIQTTNQVWSLLLWNTPQKAQPLARHWFSIQTAKWLSIINQKFTCHISKYLPTKD